MSLLQNKPKMQVSIEVSYSKERRREMMESGEVNCRLLITDLQDILKGVGVNNIRTRIPKDKKRYTDIILDFAVSSEQELDKIEKTILHEVKDSIERLDVFIEDETE